MRLLEEDHAKSAYANYALVYETAMDELIGELRVLWERAKESLPDEEVTYDVANQLGSELGKKGKLEGKKELYLATLEGRRMVLGGCPFEHGGLRRGAKLLSTSA